MERLSDPEAWATQATAKRHVGLGECERGFLLQKTGPGQCFA